MLASPAADMWALGIMAFELLTQARAFGSTGSRNELLQRVVSDAPLPWEVASPGAQARLHELRGFKHSVIQCLDRDPARRPSVQQLVVSWNRKFDATRTSLSTLTPNSRT